MLTWFKQLTRRPKAQRPRSLPPFRPEVEGLEERSLPSTLGLHHTYPAPTPAVGLTPARAATTASGFTAAPTPTLGGQGNELRAVAASSATDAWAVGDQGHFATLAEHWDGTRWSAVTTPNLGTSGNLLNGVADLAPNNAWAVGQALVGNSYVSLVEHWNGSAWSVVTSPSLPGGDNVLNAVTAVGAKDIWAAGWHRDSSTGTIQPLTEHYNGQSWSVVPNPALPGSPSLFFGISASASNDIWAVGRTGRHATPLIEHWDGTSWSVVAAPPSHLGALNSVAAVSAKDVWAVGQAGSQTLTEHWDGNQWSVVPSPNGSGGFQSVLTGVAAVSGNEVWAVGYSGNGTQAQTLIEKWDGKSWTVVPSPSPGGLSNGLNAVTAVPTGQVWGVGATSDLVGNQPGPNQALILQH